MKNWQILNRVLTYTKPYKTIFMWSIVLGIILVLIAPLGPYLIQYSITHYIQTGVNEKDNKVIDVLIRSLIVITIIQIALSLIGSILRYVFTFLTGLLGQCVIKDLREKMYDKILRLKLKQFDVTPIGTFTTRTVNDIEAINEIFSDGLVSILVDLLSIVLILVTMFIMSWKITLLVLSPFPFLLLATYIFKNQVNKSFYIVRNSIAQLNSFVQEHISGMFVVQLLNIQHKEYEKFKAINEQHKQANIKSILAYSIFFPVVEITSAISIVILIFFSLEFNLDSALVAFYFLALNQIFRPLRFIADKFNVIQMGIIASERVFKLLDNPDEWVENKSDITQKALQGKIEFQNVWFAYKEDNYILKDISFTIQPYQTVAIIGHTGSGKTSIINLINRLYEFQKGKIIIDGINIEEYNVRHLRSQISVILQDVFLFSGTILDNLRLNDDTISIEKVQESAKIMGLHDWIMTLPNQYLYEVKEKGASLSLGQKQLVAFTRAFLHNPKIVIMDEATSSIDTQTEYLLQKSLKILSQNRTTIIIAHRLSTIKNADNILCIDNGQIVEQGNHNDLLQHQGAYYKLYNKHV